MNPTHSLSAQQSGWHPAWEENVYRQGRHLNLYPYHAVVSFIYRHFGSVKNRAGVRILELGCGAGNNLWFAAREGFSVAGIDGSPTAIEFARNRFAAEQLLGDLRIGDFAELPWDNQSFDLVLDRMALSHTSREVIDLALNESQRVLKPAGQLLSIMYSWEHPGRNFGHSIDQNSYDQFTGGYFYKLGRVYFATRQDVMELFGNRFKIVALTHTHQENGLGQPEPINAFWQIEGVKKP